MKPRDAWEIAWEVGRLAVGAVGDVARMLRQPAPIERSATQVAAHREPLFSEIAASRLAEDDVMRDGERREQWARELDERDAERRRAACSDMLQGRWSTWAERAGLDRAPAAGTNGSTLTGEQAAARDAALAVERAGLDHYPRPCGCTHPGCAHAERAPLHHRVPEPTYEAMRRARFAEWDDGVKGGEG